MKNLRSCRVNVMVTDMNRAIDFYQNKLGLELLNRYEDHYAEIQAPDLQIGLHPASENVSWGDNMSIGMGVTDFDLTVEELQTKDIQLRVVQDGYMRLAYFTDPDGNQLFLAERDD
ncbi:MAG: VOC family protein [Saprospiraceae bacterium]|nr:VOC family protein [Saprospiraceae bacterium]